MNTSRTLHTVSILVAMAALAACGTEPVTPGDVLVVPVDAPPAPEGATAISFAVLGVDEASAKTWRLVVTVADLEALPVGAPVEAGPGQTVRVFVTHTGRVVNDAVCARIGTPVPACDETLEQLDEVLELHGVLTLWSSADIVTGELDAELSDDENAYARFSVSL